MRGRTRKRCVLCRPVQAKLRARVRTQVSRPDGGLLPTVVPDLEHIRRFCKWRGACRLFPLPRVPHDLGGVARDGIARAACWADGVRVAVGAA
jgi:hypothetical protein